MLLSDDPVYQGAAAIRMAVYGHTDLFINTTKPHEKLQWYEKAAALAAEPLGGLWEEAISLTNVEHNSIWSDLIQGKASRE